MKNYSIRDNTKPSLQKSITIVTLSLGLSDNLILTLMSVENQNQSTRHILIDGSNNNDIRDYCKKNFPNVEIFSQSPQGIYKAMNFGLENVSDSSYVMFLNEADFLLGPEAVSKLYRFVEDRDQWVYGGTLAFSYDSDKTFEYGYMNPNWKNFEMGLEIVPHPSSMIPAIWLKNLNGFKDALKVAADTEMNFRVYKKHGPPIHVQEFITAHELGGVSSVLQSRSNFESRLARLQNFPLLTLQKFLNSIFIQKKSNSSQKTICTIGSNPSFQHYSNCTGKERVPICCSNALLESLQQ